MIPSVNGVSFADYLAAIRSGNAQHASIDFPAQSIHLTERQVNETGIEYQLFLNSEQDFLLGLTPCAMVHMYLLNYDGSLSGIDYTDEFAVKLGVEVADSSTPPVYTNQEQTLGIFIGQKPQKVNQKIIELTGYDRMILFDQPADAFFQQEAENKTAEDYFEDLCTYVGVPYKAIGADAVNKSKLFAHHPTNGYGRTCRQILGFLAECMGCYARIAMDGECELVSFADHTSDYTALRNEQMVEPDIAEYTVSVIDKLQVTCTESDVGVIVGTGTNGYMIVDNPFLYGVSDGDIRPAAENIYNKIHAISAYTPLTTQVNGCWLVEPGDIVKLELPGGSTMDFPIFNVSILWNGNANIVYETTGSEERTPITLENQQKLQEGYKFHNLTMSIDQLVSEIGDRTGKLTTIAQDIDHLELIAQNTAHVFVSLTDPALTDVVNDGDMWVKMEFESWQDIYDNVSTWADLDDGTRTWGTIYSEEMYVRQDNRWVKVSTNAETLSNIDELRNKYNIQSGIKIEPAGIDIAGGKYIHMQAGSEFTIKSGTFDVDSTNFKVSSADKLLRTEEWTIDPYGLLHDTTKTVSGQTYQVGTQFCSETMGVKSDRSRVGIDFAYGIIPYGNGVEFMGLAAIFCYDFINSLRTNLQIAIGSKSITIESSDSEQDTYNPPEISMYNVKYLLPSRNTSVYSWVGDNSRPYTYGVFKNLTYTTIMQNSSRDIKHDITPLLPAGDRLDALEPVTFVYDDDPDEKQRAGLIYEDTIKVMPEICTGDESSKAINYVELIPYLLKEIQDLRARVKVLEEGT